MEDTAGSPAAVDRRLVILAAAAGGFGSLDSALNVAFPDLVEDLELAVADLRWVVISFVLSYGALLVVAGRLGDRFEHGRVLIAGGMLSTVAMAASAVAPSFGLLLGARVAQGMATALVMAGAPALLSTAGAGAARSAGVFQTAAAVGATVGPAIGGPLVAVGGWRAVFWFRVPLAAAIVALALVATSRGRARRQDATHPIGGSGRPPGDRPESRTTPADGHHDHGGPSPAGDRSESHDRAALAMACGLAVAVYAAAFVIWLLVPTLLVDELAASVLVSGLILAVSPLAMAIASPVATRWSERGTPTSVAAAGTLVVAVGLLVLIAAPTLGPTATEADPANTVTAVALVAIALALAGAGLGVFSVPNMALVLRALPADRQGTAGGLSLMMRTLGIVAGAQCAGLVFGVLVDGGRPFASAFQLTVALGAAIAVIAAAAAYVGPKPR